jgi:hypothetical protein
MQRKWNRRERRPERGMYALVLEEDGYEFLIDTRDLWKPPRVLVRRGYAEGEVWLDDDVSFVKSRFMPRDEQRVLALVREHIDDLLMRFLTLKDDVRRGRLGRNLLVD